LLARPSKAAASSRDCSDCSEAMDPTAAEALGDSAASTPRPAWSDAHTVPFSSETHHKSAARPSSRRWFRIESEMVGCASHHIQLQYTTIHIDHYVWFYSWFVTSFPKIFWISSAIGGIPSS
jgi:hypothetical protein